MKTTSRAAVGVVIYFLLMLAPLIALLVIPRPPGREFWREWSVALGFAGLSLMGLQFVPTARLPLVADVFPLDAVYRFHHRVSLLSFWLVLAHPLLLFIGNPFTVRLLNPALAPTRIVLGVVAVLALLVLIASSVWRKELLLTYEVWHIAHEVLALSVVALALLHILGVDYYMASPALRIVWAVLALVWLAMAAWVRLISPLLLLRKPWVLEALTPERGDSTTLTLAPVGHSGLPFRPSQVAWLTVQRSPFSIREHPFSFTSSAEHPERLQFTIRALGDFTATVKHLPAGARVYVDGPYGVFDIDRPGVPGLVFIGGGIGVAPIMSMLRTMADRQDRRPVLLVYGSRDWDAITFREELEQLQARLNLQVVHVLEHPPEGWQGERGYVTQAMFDRLLPADRNERLYFVCGPLPMLRVTERALRRLHIPVGRVHSERYEMA